jgi:hypothetical protein
MYFQKRINPFNLLRLSNQIILRRFISKTLLFQTNDFSFFQEKKAIVRAGNSINTTSKFSRSGFFLKKDGFKMIFQNAMPIFLSRGTILNYKQGDFVLEKEILATLVNYTQQTEDIVQGLPKIEELVEARRPKTKAYLSVRPGVVLNFFSSGENLGENLDTYLTSSVINCIYKGPKENELPLSTNVTLSKKKQEKQTISIGHSIYLKDEIIIHNNKIYKAIPIPSIFQPVRKNEKSNEFLFKNVKEIDEQYPLEDLDAINDDEILLVDNKAKFSIWKPEKVNLNSQNNVLYKYKNKNLVKWLTIKDIGIQTIFSNIKEDYIIFTEELNYIFFNLKIFDTFISEIIIHLK